MKDTAEELAELIASGQKIEAIRRVRELTGLGLADAKELVEKLAAGKPVSLAPRISTAPSISEIDDDLAAEVRAMVARGEALGAIRLLRQRTGCGLKEGRERVEALTGKTLRPNIGCISAASAMLLVLATLAGWLVG
jgi:ribosomal protein L7/L12